MLKIIQIALIYDPQSLQDLISSPIPLNHVIIVCPLSLLDSPHFPIKSFHKIISIHNYENSGEIISAIYKEFMSAPFVGIIAPHEIDILRAAQLRELLNLPGQHTDSAMAFRQKTYMKELLQNKGGLIHKYSALSNATGLLAFMKDTPFPFVLKPNLGTGSQGVMIFRTEADIFTYLETNNLFMRDKNPDLQVETFIKGKMYNINGFYGSNDVKYVWPSIYPQQSIEMLFGRAASSYTLDAANPLVERLNEYARTALNILPTPPQTPFHLEVFVTAEDEIMFCEIACRIGGKGVRQSWEETFGISLSSLYYQKIMINMGFEKSKEEERNVPLTPKILSGEIWFPTKQGTLKSIETHCPFSWVKDYQIFYKNGDIIREDLNNINDCLCGASLLVAKTESEMEEKLAELTNWVQETTHWE